MNFIKRILAPLIGSAFLISACGKTEPRPEPLRPVLTRIVGSTDNGNAATYSGDIRSRYETLLGFRIAGKISARLVDVGTEVKTGDVLAKLDPTDSALSAAAADAQLALAEADTKRYRELRAQNFVSQAALDAKETSLKSARAQADLAHNQNAYTVLRAGESGVIAQITAEVGQVVAAGQTVLTLARTSAPEVVLSIPESQLPEMKLGMPAEVRLWVDENAAYQGVLRELAQVADPATRTYAARVKILAPDDRVRLGMTARVRLKTGQDESRTIIPLTAIFQQDGKPAVWIVGADETVALRPVVVATLDEKSAILESGLQAGERIVVAGVHKLAAGEKIRPVDQTTTSQ